MTNYFMGPRKIMERRQVECRALNVFKLLLRNKMWEEGREEAFDVILK